MELVEGGDSRHASEFNVLQYLASDIESGAIDVVLIHDAARPLAGPDMMRTALAVAREFGGAVPALAAPDVVGVAQSGDFAPSRTDRNLVRVQTPQAFRALPLLRRIGPRTAKASTGRTRRRASNDSPMSKSARSAAIAQPQGDLRPRCARRRTPAAQRGSARRVEMIASTS